MSSNQFFRFFRFARILSRIAPKLQTSRQQPPLVLYARCTGPFCQHGQLTMDSFFVVGSPIMVHTVHCVDFHLLAMPYRRIAHGLYHAVKLLQKVRQYHQPSVGARFEQSSVRSLKPAHHCPMVSWQLRDAQGILAVPCYEIVNPIRHRVVPQGARGRTYYEIHATTTKTQIYILCIEYIWRNYLVKVHMVVYTVRVSSVTGRFIAKSICRRFN